MSKLTPKQQLFVSEYLIDLNATQAAARAGYSEKSAKQTGTENLAKPAISAAIQEALRERSKRTEITADRVLLEYARIAFFDVRRLYSEDGRLKPIQELDDDCAAVLTQVEAEELFAGAGEEREHVGYIKKVKVVDKKGALDSLSKHLGIFKPKKIEHTGPDGGPIEMKQESEVNLIDVAQSLSKTALGKSLLEALATTPPDDSDEAPSEDS